MTATEADPASPPSSVSSTGAVSADILSATRPPATSLSLTSPPNSHSSFSSSRAYSNSSSRARVASSRSWKASQINDPPVRNIRIPPLPDKTQHVQSIVVQPQPVALANVAAIAAATDCPSLPSPVHSAHGSVSAEAGGAAAASIFRIPYVTPLFLARFLPNASPVSPILSPITSSTTTPLSLPRALTVSTDAEASPVRPTSKALRSELHRQRRLTPLRREWTLRDLTKRKRVGEREKQQDGSQKVSSLLQRVLVMREQYSNTTVSAATVSADFAYSSSTASLPSTLATLPLSSVSPPTLSHLLTFHDPNLEASYRSDFLSRYFHSLRRSVLLSSGMWLLFTITDVVKWVDGKRPAFVETLALRFSVALFVVATTSLTYYPPVRRLVTINVLRAALCCFILLFGACQVQFGVLQGDTLDPTYCTFIILLSSMSASWFRLPCFLSIACNVLLCAVFVAMTAASGSYTDCSSFITATVWVAIAVVLFSFHGYSIEWDLRSTYLSTQQLGEQEQRSQRVLATMLPLRVISELRTARAFVHERHEHVSILFSHIHDFDKVTSELAARQLVELLNGLFSRFDLLTDLLGVYKVETIGDVYLVSAGVPDRLERHACVLALLALCMLEEMRQLSTSLQLDLLHLRLRLRVGLHSGPVIAGVVGVKYPRFRLMGDTVNTASRMSTTCQASQIQLSRATFQQLSDRFVCQYNGRTSIKGKGGMHTYLLRYVLPVEGSAAMLPISAEEACGDKTAQQVAAELGCGVLTSPIAHTRSVSVVIPRGAEYRTGRAEQQHNPLDLLELPSPPSLISAREASAPLPSDTALSAPTSASIALYHARPVPGCLYANSRLEANVLCFEADDVQAVLAKADSGEFVHRLHRSRADVDEQNETEVRHTVVESEEKQQPGAGLTAGAHERYTASPVLRLDGVHRRTTLLPVLEPAQREEHKDQPSPRFVHDSGSESGSPITPQSNDNSAASSALPSVASEQPRRLAIAVVPASSPTAHSDTAPMFACSPLSPASPVLAIDDPPSPVLLPPAAPLVHTLSQSDMRPASPPSASSLYTISATAVSVSFLQAVPTLPELRNANPLRLAFCRHPQMESAFQVEWSRRTLRVTRRGVATLLCCLVVLGCYDTYVNRSSAPAETGSWAVLAATWALRLLALSLGGGVLCVSYWRRAWFCRHQQPVVFACWTLIAMLQSICGMVLSVSTSSYEVTTTLVLITSTSFFVGLQFRYVALSTLLQLLFYVVAELSQRGDILNAFFLLASAVLSSLSAHSAEYFQRLDYVGYLRLTSDERKTRDILDHMLPPAVMNDILKQQLLGGPGSGPVVAHDVSTASVLFCDIVSFTSLAASVGAEDVVAILNIVFSTFDALTTRHKVYKVETIGDAYLACSGVVQPASGSAVSATSFPTTASSHSENLVKCALDFQSASQYFRTPTNAAISVRIGIHTGPVIAGVVGRKMPRYHLFGSTVTLAEEMEHSGVAGGVVISGETHRAVGGAFACRAMSELAWSGGLLQRWRVLHCRTELGVYGGGQGGEEGEGGLPSLPGVVSDILRKVHEANVREQEARERRWFGSDASSSQHAAHKQAMEATSERLTVHVMGSTMDGRVEGVSAVAEPRKEVGRRAGSAATVTSRRRSSSDAFHSRTRSTGPVFALQLLSDDMQPIGAKTAALPTRLVIEVPVLC